MFALRRCKRHIYLILIGLVVWGVPMGSGATEGGIDPAVQCMPWDVPQNVLDGEGRSDFDLFHRPVGTVRGAVVFVDFPDAPATETTQEVFEDVAAPAVPFYDSVSYGALDLQMSPLHEWLRMPQPSTAYELSRDDEGTFDDYIAYVQTAVDLADPEFDFSETDLLYVVASENADADFSPESTAYPGDGAEADGNEIRQMATMGTDTRLPGFGTYVLPHETGHMFSLPDLYSYSGDDHHGFAGPWDLMGDLSLGGGLMAWHKLKVGWLGADDIACVGPDSEVDVEISPLATAGGMEAAIVRTGPATAYVAEVRRFMGEDARLCDSGVLIYEVDSSVRAGQGPIRVRSAGGAPERAGCVGLEGAAYDVGEMTVFEDSEAGVRFEVLSTDGEAYTVRVSNAGDFDAETPVTYGRSISASFGGARIQGDVGVVDEAFGCVREVKVKVQKKTRTGFKTVKQGMTDPEGHYDIEVDAPRGKFRALVPKLEFSPFNTCGKKASPTIRP